MKFDLLADNLLGKNAGPFKRKLDAQLHQLSKGKSKYRQILSEFALQSIAKAKHDLLPKPASPAAAVAKGTQMPVLALSDDDKPYKPTPEEIDKILAEL